MVVRPASELLMPTFSRQIWRTKRNASCIIPRLSPSSRDKGTRLQRAQISTIKKPKTNRIPAREREGTPTKANLIAMLLPPHRIAKRNAAPPAARVSRSLRTLWFDGGECLVIHSGKFKCISEKNEFQADYGGCSSLSREHKPENPLKNCLSLTPKLGRMTNPGRFPCPIQGSLSRNPRLTVFW